jgi:hypothetical protein
VNGISSSLSARERQPHNADIDYRPPGCGRSSLERQQPHVGLIRAPHEKQPAPVARQRARLELLAARSEQLGRLPGLDRRRLRPEQPDTVQLFEAKALVEHGRAHARGGGIYHSIYDSFAWYTRFSDGEFTHGRALAQLAGTLILRFADATVLPFRFAGYADAVARYVSEVATLHQQQSGAPAVDLEPLRRAVATLAESAERYERAIGQLRDLEIDVAATQPEPLHALNRTLYLSERALGHEAGLPTREWFRHLVYAPGLYTGYGVKTLPAIREGIEQKTWDEVRTYVPIVTAAVERLAGEVDRAAAMLGEIVR